MPKDRNLLALAKSNRKRPTISESKIWSFLRRKNFGLKFRRQYQIGDYIADFACKEISLIIECDGGQHDLKKQQDDSRTEFFNSLGYKVLRFWNIDILKTPQAVYEAMEKEIEERLKYMRAAHSPSPSLSPEGERENNL